MSLTIPVGGTCPDCIAIDKNTAMLFTDEAPLAKTIVPKEGKAVWAFVPDSVQTAKNVTNVAIFFHGYNAWVNVDQTHPGGFTPQWERNAVAAREKQVKQKLVAKAPSPNGSNSKTGNGNKHAAGPKYELDQPLAHDALVLVPTVAAPVAETAVVKDANKNPVQITLTDGTVGDQLTLSLFSRDDPGTLTRKGAVIENMIFDCFEHLRILKPNGESSLSFYLPGPIACRSKRTEN